MTREINAIYNPAQDRMTPKERVRRTVLHQETDRVPVDYGSNPGIDARLKEYFGLTPDDGEGLLRALGVDFRNAWPAYVGPQLHVPPSAEIQVDYWGKRRRYIEHESGGYWDYCDWPLTDAGEEEVEQWPLPSPDDFDYDGLKRRVEENSGYAIVVGGPGVGDIINSTGMLRTMEQVLVDLMTDEPAGLRLIDRKLEIMLEIARRTLETLRGHVDLFWIGEDLGTQRGPIVSTDLFRRHLRPRLQRFVDLAHHYDLPVMIHSCGSSSWAFPDFIEMGISMIDTLQPEAANMEPAYLKSTFGDNLGFHGMISTAGPLAYGSADDVIENCRETLQTMMPGGGYALAPTHSIQDNSPTENVLAMYRTAHQYGRYQ